MTALFNNFTEMYESYISDGFTFERVLTSKERKEHDLKAHKLQELLNVEFKYVPLQGKHYYLFSCEEHAKEFDRLCGKDVS